jgi:hypothetical protein
MTTAKNDLSVHIKFKENELTVTLSAMPDLNHQHYQILGAIVETAYEEFNEPRIKVEVVA